VGKAGAAGLHLACTVSEATPAGRGLVATARLAAGSAAAAIPPPALLTADAAVAASPAASAAASHSPHAAIITALAEARTVPGSAAAAGWGPYARALPASTGCVLEWDPPAVAWLAGSPLAAVAASARGEAAEAAEAAVIPALVDAAGLDSASAAAAAAWAASMLLSRLVRTGNPALDGGAGGTLVPWLDMANHGPGSGRGAPAAIGWEEASGAVVLRVTRTTPPSSPILASYGPDRPAGEMLLAYGFVPPAGLETPGGGLAIAPPLAALLPLRPGRLPAGLVEQAALCAATPADVDALAGRLLDGGGPPPPPALLAAGARAAADAATAALAAKKAAAAGPPTGDDSPLACMVRDVLARERRALEGAAADLAAAARAWEREGRAGRLG